MNIDVKKSQPEFAVAYTNTNTMADDTAQLYRSMADERTTAYGLPLLFIPNRGVIVWELGQVDEDKRKLPGDEEYFECLPEPDVNLQLISFQSVRGMAEIKASSRLKRDFVVRGRRPLGLSSLDRF